MVKAIILAAGKGTGFGSGHTIPRCLIEIGGRTILERQIDALKSCGINPADIFVVIGGTGDIWNEKNKEKIKSIHKNIIVNNENIQKGQSYSLFIALKNIDEDVICMDGDLILTKKVIDGALSSTYPSLLVTTRGDTFSDGNRVIVKGERVRGIGRNVLSDKIYAGVAKFSKEFVRVLKNELRSEKYATTTIDAPLYALCIDNFIHIVDVGDGDGEANFLGGGSYAITKEILAEKNNVSELGVQKIVRKEATEGKQKLINEIEWILALPEDVKPHFPRILRYSTTSDPVYVEMEKYPMKTLRRFLIDGEINAEQALQILNNVLNFTFQKMYSRNIKLLEEKSIIEGHLKRVEDRLEEAKRKASLFVDVISAERVILNGKKMSNMPELIDRLKKNARVEKIMKQARASLVHGDLHFDNILVDKNDFSKFILIDPRGKMYDGSIEGDYAYDLGKIWHSANGLYDFLHEGNFNLDISLQNKTLLADFRIAEHPAVGEYKKIFLNLPELLYKHELIKEDTNWNLRATLNEAIHFCSMVPFHIHGEKNEKKAVAMYLRGIMLLDKFLDEIEFNFVDSTVVNINSAQDYMKAKRLFE